MQRGSRWLLVGCVCCLGACGPWPQERGDATLYDNNNFPFMAFDVIEYPAFPLAASQTHVWQTDAFQNRPLFDMELRVLVDDRGRPGQASWQQATVTVALHDASGNLVWEQAVDLSTWKGGGNHVDGQHYATFQILGPMLGEETYKQMHEVGAALADPSARLSVTVANAPTDATETALLRCLVWPD